MDNQEDKQNQDQTTGIANPEQSLPADESNEILNTPPIGTAPVNKSPVPNKDTSQTETKVLDGEVELPHQASEFMPEEIVEPEQEPPKEIISKESARLSALHDQVDKAFLTLKAEEERLKNLRTRREAIEKKLHHLKSIVTNPVQAIPETPGGSKSEGSESLQNSNLLNQKFLQKMSFLRIGANKKRTWQVEANLLKIMEFAKKQGRVTNNDVEGLTGVQHTQASQYLKMLQKDKKLRRFGSGRLTHYKPA